MCATFEGGALRCWGANEGHQVHNPCPSSPTDTPGAEASPEEPPSPAALSLPSHRAHPLPQLGYADAQARGDAVGTMGDALPAVQLDAPCGASLLHNIRRPLAGRALPAPRPARRWQWLTARRRRPRPSSGHRRAHERRDLAGRCAPHVTRALFAARFGGWTRKEPPVRRLCDFIRIVSLS